MSNEISISIKVGQLELRSNETMGGLEIVEWSDTSKPYCRTVAYWKKEDTLKVLTSRVKDWMLLAKLLELGAFIKDFIDTEDFIHFQVVVPKRDEGEK